ncbi:MAG: hypothetical protein B2I17_08945 [Thermoplasmatales archaeon B_DKE]|nr:MAG: hypothetical protein B2I17_08945 [Thermoplasmatales archaeon B_DKE]
MLKTPELIKPGNHINTIFKLPGVDQTGVRVIFRIKTGTLEPDKTAQFVPATRSTHFPGNCTFECPDYVRPLNRYPWRQALNLAEKAPIIFRFQSIARKVNRVYSS